jgi:NRAMP (natural resistance-associated macrophage protein)-like metal ion transporter
MLQSTISRALNYWKKLGPGLVTGAADDDPSGIATYSQTGAGYGPSLIWLSIVTFPFMSVVQEMCARIGMVTGRGLAANIKAHFPRPLLIACTILLFVANTFNIGADLGAIAEATRLVFPGLHGGMLVVAFTVFSLLLQIFTSYKTYAQYLKWLTVVLFSYIITAFAIDLHWSDLFYHLFVPHMSFDKQTLLLIAAILGTTISPYLFFWQSSQEVEEKEGKKNVTADGLEIVDELTKADISTMRIDVWTGMFVSNLVMFFIIAVCSGTLFKHGITNIATAADAAAALLPLAGRGAYLLFALGIVGTGLLAIPVLAGSASYAISETMNWQEGLARKFREARAFYWVLIASMLVGLILNFIGLDPIKALIYSAVVNCIVAPIVLVFIVILSGSKQLMGEWASGKLATVIGWLLTFVMAGVGIATIVEVLF